jgi:hypothetical protein
MDQRGSLFSPWADKLMVFGLSVAVPAVLVAGSMGVAKFLAPNNDSDAGAVRDVIVLQPRQSIQFLESDGKDTYSLSICTNSSSDPRASPRDAGSCSDFHNVNGETRVFKLKEVSPDANNPSNGIDLGTIESLERQR